MSLQDSRRWKATLRRPGPMPGVLSSELSPPLTLAISLPAEHTKSCPYYECLHQGHP